MLSETRNLVNQLSGTYGCPARRTRTSFALPLPVRSTWTCVVAGSRPPVEQNGNLGSIPQGDTPARGRRVGLRDQRRGVRGVGRLESSCRRPGPIRSHTQPPPPGRLNSPCRPPLRESLRWLDHISRGTVSGCNLLGMRTHLRGTLAPPATIA